MKKIRICKVDSCNTKHCSRGYCKRHYMQIKRHGRITNILECNRKKHNEYIHRGDYYEICLYNMRGVEVGRALIDGDNYDKIKNYKWYLHDSGYVKTTNVEEKNKKTRRLHHFILPPKNGFVIDHINGNKLDNRRDNLRHATQRQNLMNKKAKGVSWNKKDKKWHARIGFYNKKIHLGSFDDKEKAMIARKEAELIYFGEYAYKD